IYGRYPDVIDYSYRCKVFIVSPTTLMAYITAIKAIYLGQSKNEKVVQMQQELQKLSNEFERFTARWANITKDFEKTSEDIQSIDTTAKKIVNQFRKIDNIELDGLTEVVEYEEH
ncbi:MAG: DNA recombination protein RmuC, partial [Erysipelotrichaceae bacterium]|nr:DNA recombination protein RmuC [Erysipelotrichaceae bacterium]